MRYINDGLPEFMFRALSERTYSRGDADISVTQMIDSPRVRVLTKKYDEEIVRSASKDLASFHGTAFHEKVERSNKIGVSERRLDVMIGGWKLSGGTDHYEDGVISDIKTANVYKVMYAEKGIVEEFENQLNVYAFLHREHNIPVKELRIFISFKDWNRRGFSEAFKKGKLWVPYKSAGYPDKHWAYYKLPLWPEERARDYVHTRIRLHQEAEENLPRCSVKEVWRGMRCASYCDVAQWCDQYQKSKQTGLLQEEE